MHRRHTVTAGFTLIELLVTMIIIVVLIGILIPTVTKIRLQAQAASTKNQLNTLVAAIDRFHQEQGHYPGPMPDSWIYTNLKGGQAPAIRDANDRPMRNADKITQSENLFMALCGGVKWVTPPSGQSYLKFDPDMVGKRCVTNVSNPTKPMYQAIVEYKPEQATLKFDSTMGTKIGKYADNSGAADDSDLPEFIDSFSNPMPFIYAPARVGLNGVITDDIANNNVNTGQYRLSDFWPYTFGAQLNRPIGEGKRVKARDYVNPSPAQPPSGVFYHGLQSADSSMTIHKGKANKTYRYPYDAYAYMISPDSDASGTLNPVPRSKDTFILISAGIDRVYGTEDDICSFGDLKP